MEAQDLHCPICGRIDLVQKASRIIYGETVYGEVCGGGEGASVRVHSTSQAVLSSQLVLPELNLVFLDQMRIAGIVILYFAIPWALFGSWVAFYTVWGKYMNIQSAGIVYLPAVFGLLFFLLALILKSKKIALERQKRERTRAMWERLYYCYRDDIVFASDSHSPIYLHQMQGKV